MGAALCDGWSLLADIYPDPFVSVNTDEASDWELVGDDLRESLQETADDPLVADAIKARDHDDELVEA